MERCGASPPPPLLNTPSSTIPTCCSLRLMTPARSARPVPATSSTSTASFWLVSRPARSNPIQAKLCQTNSNRTNRTPRLLSRPPRSNSTSRFLLTCSSSTKSTTRTGSPPACCRSQAPPESKKLSSRLTGLFPSPKTLPCLSTPMPTSPTSGPLTTPAMHPRPAVAPVLPAQTRTPQRHGKPQPDQASPSPSSTRVST